MAGTSVSARAQLQRPLIQESVEYVSKDPIAQLDLHLPEIAHQAHIVEQLSCRQYPVNVPQVIIVNQRQLNSSLRTLIWMVELFVTPVTIVHLVLKYKSLAQQGHSIHLKENQL